MLKRQFCCFVLLVLLLSYPATAQLGFPGARDTAFNLGNQYGFLANPLNPTPGEGANLPVWALAVQPDGKVLLAGDFTAFNGRTQNRITRILPDGSIDSTFQIGSGASSTVRTLLLQPDGKVIVGGEFFTFNGTQRQRMARLFPNGQLDTTFNPGTGVNGFIRASAILPDGKVMIAGQFTSVNGLAINRVARLNPNGSVDTSFNPGTAANNEIQAMVVQPDGKILIAGNFTSYAGISRMRIARIHANGSLDTTFNPGTGSSETIQSIGLLQNGKMFISGAFQMFDGRPRRCIARLHADGRLDTTTNFGTGVNGISHTISILPDGKVLISGFFSEINGVTRNQVARLHPDGSLDTAFNTGLGTVSFNSSMGSPIYTHALQSDGKVLIGGVFAEFNGFGRNRVARLLANGSLDLAHNPGTGANGSVWSLARLPDGRIYAAGNFASYNDMPYRYIVRLFPDGRLDTSFNTGTGPNYFIASVAIQPDGKVVIGGNFSAINGIARNNIARLNQDGSVDTTFNPGSGPNTVVLNTLVQADSKILIQGLFGTVNGVSRAYIARLHANGQVDTSFQTGTFSAGSTSVWMYSMALQPDGKILVAGQFVAYNTVSRGRILRLNTDGSLDLTFNSNSGASGAVHAIAVQPDGKVLIGGEFVGYNFSARNRIARLNADGTLDLTFNAQGGANLTVRTIAVQTDSLILVGGEFTSINGTARNRIARLHPSGALDTTYNPGSGVNDMLFNILLQPDGKALLAGWFTTYNGNYCPRIVRVLGGTCAGLVTNITSSTPICVGSTKMLSGTPGGRWVIASGPGSIVGNTYVASGGAGTVQIFNILASCSSPVVTFTVVAIPLTPLVMPPAPICEGQRATISPTAGGTSYRFFADSTAANPLPGGDGVTSFVTPILTTTTTYYVSSLIGPGCESIARRAVTISVNPVPMVSIVQAGDTLLADSSSGTYQWYRDQVAIVGANMHRFVPNQSGMYTVVLTNPEGCTDTSNAINVVIAGLGFDQKVGTFAWTTYPVPFQEQLTIGAEEAFFYELLDARGTVVLRGQSDDRQLVLETAHLASGVYLIKVVANQQTAVRRVVKR